MSSDPEPHASAVPADLLADTAPALEGQASVAGLDGPVEVVRDRWGIAHVRASSETDAFVGQGFAAAQDRLWQMDSDRRRASGAWSAIVGPGGVAGDTLVRRLGLIAAARRDLSVLADETRAMLDAYAVGVNAHLASTDVRPIECELTGAVIEPWEPWHSLLVYKFRHLFMGTFRRKLWRAAMLSAHGADRLATLVEPLPQHLIVPPGAFSTPEVELAAELAAGVGAVAEVPETDGASNNWGLAGARTASGLPLLAGDPHRGLDLPNVYHQNHLMGGGLDVIGMSFPGVPGYPHFGHNREVAWCITHAMADDQDVYVERLGAAGAVQSRRSETIEVRGAEPVEIAVLTTENGPVIALGPGEDIGLSMRWTGLAEADTTLDAVLAVMGSSTVPDVVEACRSWVIPAQNLVIGDVSGSIGYRLRGRIPVRDAANGWLPVPGWDPAHRWHGYVPDDDLPRVIDPEDDFVCSANNRIADEPYVSHDYAPPGRAARLVELLAEVRDATVGTCTELHADVRSEPARWFAQRMAAVEVSGELGVAADLLRSWDGELAADSPAAALYTTTRTRMTMALTAELGLDRGTIGVLGEQAPPPECATQSWRAAWAALRRGDDDEVAGLGGWNRVLVEALGAAVTELTGRFGPEPADWDYGTLRRTAMWWPLELDAPHLAGRLPVPEAQVAGDGDTLRASAIQIGQDHRSVHGSVARYVFDLADWDGSGWAVVHGVSGNPGAAHHTDQLAAWAACELVPMVFTSPAIDRHKECSYLLTPGG